jgi:hypothetical protein
MRKRINLVSVVMLLIALASFVAAAKGHGTTYGFFSGG